MLTNRVLGEVGDFSDAPLIDKSVGEGKKIPPKLLTEVEVITALVMHDLSLNEAFIEVGRIKGSINDQPTKILIKTQLEKRFSYSK